MSMDKAAFNKGVIHAAGLHDVWEAMALDDLARLTACFEELAKEQHNPNAAGLAAYIKTVYDRKIGKVADVICRSREQVKFVVCRG